MQQNQKKQQQDFKKKREEFTQNLRKQNRQQRFSKKRNILSNQNESNYENYSNRKERSLIVDDRYAEDIEKFLTSDYQVEDFNDLIQNFNDSDIIRQHYGLIGIRKILSSPQNPPIQQVIDAGLVPKMIQYIRQYDYPQLQLQATWALTNVASGTSNQCQTIIDKGGIPLFVSLLKSSNLGIVQQAIWAIGNVASDCVAHRDNIINHGGIRNLVQVIENNPNSTNVVKHGAWALSNLCRGNPLPKYQNVKNGIFLLCHLVATGQLNEKQIIGDCCWAISYHSDTKKNKIEVLMNTNVIPRIVSYINDDFLSLVVPCIRILGNVSSGTAIQTDEILKSGGIEQLYRALFNNKKLVRREACWVLSNITAGVKYQLEQVATHNNLISRLLDLFDSDQDDVKRQICYIFSNLSQSGEPMQIFHLYKNLNIIKYYSNMLDSDDNKSIEVSLQCLFIMLEVGERIKGSGKNPLVLELFAYNAVDTLEKLQYHESDIIYSNVSKVLQTYFEIQDPLKL